MKDLTQIVADAAKGWDSYAAARARQLNAWEDMKNDPDGDLIKDMESPWWAAAKEEIRAASEWDRTHGYALKMTERAYSAFLAWEEAGNAGMMPSGERSFTGEEEWQTTAREMGIDTTGWLVREYDPYADPAHPLAEKVEEEIQFRGEHLSTPEWTRHRADAGLSKELEDLDTLHTYLNR